VLRCTVKLAPNHLLSTLLSPHRTNPAPLRSRNQHRAVPIVASVTPPNRLERPNRERNIFLFSIAYTLFSIRDLLYLSYFVSTTDSLRKTPGGRYPVASQVAYRTVTTIESKRSTKIESNPNKIKTIHDTPPGGWGSPRTASHFGNGFLGTPTVPSRAFGGRNLPIGTFVADSIYWRQTTAVLKFHVNVR